MKVEQKNTNYYSQEDVQQILQIAIARQADEKNKEFSYEQLLEIAAELQISPESLQQAESEWLVQQGEKQQHLTFNAYRRGKFKKRLGNYTIVNGVLLLIDLLQGGGLSWALYVLLFWGIPVGLDGWKAYQTEGEEYEAAFQRWYRQRQVKQLFNTTVNRWLKSWQIY
ncbi:2TM domain-containing protein [Iningainema tapete]|nr:2TM domain-containing protein [Iningainema tapete]